MLSAVVVYDRVEVCCLLGSCSVFIFKGGNGKLEPIVYWSHQVSQPLRDSHCVCVCLWVCERERGREGAFYRPCRHVNA